MLAPRSRCFFIASTYMLPCRYLDTIAEEPLIYSDQVVTLDGELENVDAVFFCRVQDRACDYLTGLDDKCR